MNMRHVSPCLRFGRYVRAVGRIHKGSRRQAIRYFSVWAEIHRHQVEAGKRNLALRGIEASPGDRVGLGPGRTVC